MRPQIYLQCIHKICASSCNPVKLELFSLHFTEEESQAQSSCDLLVGTMAVRREGTAEPRSSDPQALSLSITSHFPCDAASGGIRLLEDDSTARPSAENQHVFLQISPKVLATLRISKNRQKQKDKTAYRVEMCIAFSLSF